jgi:thiamine-phosphate pyrophosphorylase
LCKDDFLKRVACLASGKPHAIILREKDLSTEAYQALAEKLKIYVTPPEFSLL